MAKLENNGGNGLMNYEKVINWSLIAFSSNGRVQGGDKERMMTMVIAYDTVFGENREPLEGHAILGSWEVDSNSVYIIDLSRHARSKTNPNLTPEIRTKIKKAFRQTGINQVTNDRVGLGIGAIKHYCNTCAATCLMTALF